MGSWLGKRTWTGPSAKTATFREWRTSSRLRDRPAPTLTLRPSRNASEAPMTIIVAVFFLPLLRSEKPGISGQASRMEGSSRIASTSSSLKSFRRRNSSGSPPTKIAGSNFLTKRMWGPAPSRKPFPEAASPRMSEVIPTTAMIPMTTPRMVRDERSLFAFRVARAIRKFSTRARRADLLIAQRLDGIQPRRAVGRVDSEDQPHHEDHHQRQDDRPGIHGGGKRGGHSHHLGEGPSQNNPHDPPKSRQGDRLDQELPEDVFPFGPQRLPDPDLPGPLRDRDEHDVHDDDSPDHERQGDQARGGAEDHGRDLLPEALEGLRGLHREVILLVRLQVVPDPHRHPRLVHGPGHLFLRGRLDRDRDGLESSELLQIGPDGDRDHLVLTQSQDRSQLRRDADDRVWLVLDPDRFAQGLGPAQELVGHLSSEDHDRAGAFQLRGGEKPPPLDFEIGRDQDREGLALDVHPVQVVIPETDAVGRADVGGDVPYREGASLDLLGILEGDPWALAKPIDLLVARDDERLALDNEDVSPEAGHLVLHVPVHPVDDGNHGDDGGDSDDVSKDREDGAELVCPEGAQGDSEPLAERHAQAF